MLGERVAILAVTLLCCKWLPRQSTSFTVTERSPLRRGNRSRPTERRPATPATTVVFVIASQPLTGAEDFGSHYPQTGRFGPPHKRGPVPAAAGEEEEEEEQEEEADESWSTALAALAASGTALALRTDTEASPSSSSGEESDGGGGDRLQQGVRAQRYRHRWRQREPRQHSNQRRLDDLDRTANGPFMLSSLLQRLQTELSSNVDALSSWSSKRCSQLRDRAGVAAAAAAAAATHRPLLFSHRPSQALRELQLAGAQAVDSAARGAQSGLDQLTWRLSGATNEAGRRAEALLSAARTSRKEGFRLIGVSLARCGLRGGRGIGSWRKGERDGGDAAGEEEGEYEGSRLARLTDMTVQNVVDVVARDGWEHVTTTSGVVVHRQYIALGPDGRPVGVEGGATEVVADAVSATGMGAAAATASGAGAEAGAGGATGAMPVGRETPAPTDGGGGRSTVSTPEAVLVGGGGEVEGREADAGKAAQFACVKATAVLSVPPEVVYLLFADNSRVGEYNEHCREVMDLEILSEDSKITWAASGRMGPFKARDFCTLVHFRTLSDGTLAQVSRPVEHPAAPRSSRYVRSEILLAGNFMRPVPGDPSRTEFLMVTHVNPGGAAETRAGAMLVNSLCASSPVNFIRRLEVAAQKLMLELQESSAHDANAAGTAAGAERGAVPLSTPPPPPPPPPLPPQQPPPPPQQPPELEVPRSGFNGVEECGVGTVAAGTGGSGSEGGSHTSGGSGNAGVEGEFRVATRHCWGSLAVQQGV